ncbi:LOW QUALITY PROTEIN: butyrophilin-like protein 8 [Trichechus inunguis]
MASVIYIDKIIEVIRCEQMNKCGKILVLTIYLPVAFLPTGQWEVIGPCKPVQALVGEDAMFSCFLSPEMSAEAMEVQFFRNQFSAMVHIYKNGKDQTYIHHGRNEFMKDLIAEEHVFLKLKDITPLDADMYGCWFSSQTYYQTATWELQVSALGSILLISIMYVDGGICSSGWFPQSTVKWKGPQGQDLPSDSKVNADRHGMFDVETICLPLSTCPTLVRIFLHYEGGTISFFNKNNQSLIYTLPHQFQTLLSLCIEPSIYLVENPIVICPVYQGSEREALFQRVLTSPDTHS